MNVIHEQDVTYFSSFIANSQLNNLDDIGQSQRSLRATHPLILVIINAKYEKSASRTLRTVERTTKCVPHFSSFIANSCLNDLKDIS